MRLLRIEAIASGRTDLELHPQLTVLRGTPPEFRRRFVSLLESMTDGSSLDFSGLIEVNGVQLALERDTLDGLELREPIDWVFMGDVDRVMSSTSQMQGTDGHRPGSVRTEEISALSEEREALRATAAERTALAERMDRVRDRLDSFANAALEVCVGQIDALESRRSGLRDRWERHRLEASRRVQELESRYRERSAEFKAVTELDLSQVEAARDALEAVSQAQVAPDPESAELALRIDGAMRRLRDQSGLSASVGLRRREAEQRLAEAVAEAAAEDRLIRHRQVDPAVVERLEQVRDQMFAADESQSRLSVNRNRRRMSALRQEEAELLAELGFDTYSSYVMGIPSLSSEVERKTRVEGSRSRIEEIQRELDSMADEEPSPQLLAASETELKMLLGQAAGILGEEYSTPTATVSLAGASSFEPVNAPTADVVHDVIIRLRERQLVAPADSSHEVLGAADDLRASVRRLGEGRFSVGDPTSAPRIAGESIDAAAWDGTPRALLDGVDAWLISIENRDEWLAAAQGSLEELTQQITEMRSAQGPPEGLSEWADVESELDVLLDRLASAQERVRNHEDALEELAGLREIELEIRARERKHMATIAALEQRLRDSSDQPSTPTSDSDRTAEPERSDEETTAEVIEWRLISTAARRHSVSFVGPLPLLVDGVPRDPAARSVLANRIGRLSELVQMVVLTDDDWFCGWAGSLGSASSVITL